ncbi:MAG: hypothetical protein E7271_04440 [Lachnospiraceae bacterium]|jgi:c-di-GMP-binding flagellar brake protein YcgR|nr:hypothetical protein [Lachnospiraceae bacterium]
MDSKITIGDKIDLKKIENRIAVNPNRDVPVYVSQVLDEADFGDVLCAMPISEGRVIPLSVGDEYDTTFYTSSGLLNCQTQVTGRYKKGSLFLLSLRQLTELKKIQRREYFRLDCHNPVKYRVLTDIEKLDVEVGKKSTVAIDECEWKDGIMIDLSGGGIRFVSGTREEIMSLIQVRFEIIEDGLIEAIYAYAKVLRSERTPNKSNVFDQRVEFFGMKRGMRERIIKYIFDTQRKSRVKESGME